MKVLTSLALTSLLFFTGCRPSEDAVGLLPPNERAPQFDKVSNFLDLGGVFYAYMDLTGEAEALGKQITEIVESVRQQVPQIPQAAGLPLDFVKVMEATGFSGLHAVGMSSREIGDGMFHNRSILFFNEGPEGLFRLFGDTPHPFDSLDLAPASSDVVFELSYRPEEVRDSVLAIGDALAGAFGRSVITAQLDSPQPDLGGRTVNEMIEQIGNRMMLIVDFDNENLLPFGSFGNFPYTDFLIAFDGVTELIESNRAFLEQQPQIAWTDTDTGFEIKVTQSPPPPFDYVQPVLIADSTTQRVFLASNQVFLDECLQNSDKLKNTDDFRQAANLLPPEGISFSYVSPEYPEAIMTFVSSAMGTNPLFESQFSGIMEMLIPDMDQSIASVTTVGPEGLYSASNLNYSHRTTLATLAVQPLAFAVGMSSAMAIPAFQKVRANSQEKTITNNLRQVASAGQQFMLEEGVTEASYSDLVHEYFPPISPVDGEDYTSLEVKGTGGTLSVTTASGDTVEYEY